MADTEVAAVAARSGLIAELSEIRVAIVPLFDSIPAETTALRHVFQTGQPAEASEALGTARAWLAQRGDTPWAATAAAAFDALESALEAEECRRPDEAEELAASLRAARRAIQSNVQTGDAVSQRLEHVIHGLSGSAERGGAEGAAADLVAAQLIGGAREAMEAALGQIRTSVEKLSQGLETARGMALPLSASLETALRALDMDDSDGLDGDARAEIAAQTAKLRRAALNKVCPISARIDVPAIESVAERLERLASLHEQIGSFRARFVAAEKAAVALSEEASETLTAEATAQLDLDWLFASYTMEDERRIHTAAVAGLTVEDPAGIAENEGPDDANQGLTEQRPPRIVTLFNVVREVLADPGDLLLPLLTGAMAFMGMLGCVIILATGVHVQLATVALIGCAAGLTGVLTLSIVIVRMIVRQSVTRLERARHDMENMALRDPLTGHYNRRGLQDRMARDLAPGRDGKVQPLTLMHIDLDHFKSVNDTIGHDAGDHVLCVAGERMAAAVGESGYVSRVGGDEFCIVLPGTDEEARAEAVGAELITQMRLPIDFEGQSCQIGASIGIAFGGDSLRDPERLLTNADMAALVSKAGGRGRYSFFDESLRAALESETDILRRLTAALDQEALEVWFQPVMLRGDAGLHSAEALLRWHDADGTAVAPEDFLPIAEKHNLLEAIHDLVVSRTLDAIVRWRESGLELPRVTLNLAGTEVKLHGMVDRLRFALDRRDLRPDCLGVEVSETAVIGRGAELAVAALSDMRGLGIEVVVDHFGRDQGALSNLALMGASAVKIDRGVVAQLGQSADSTTLLKGLASLAGSLGLDVIAKGVESRDQLRILETVDCAGLQGFAIAPPMTAESFAEWCTFHVPAAEQSAVSRSA